MEILPILSFIVLSASFIKAASVGNNSPHEFTKVLNKSPEYVVHISTSGDTVKINLEVETSGYVGFGFSPSGTMHGAELFIGGVEDDGQTLYSGVYQSMGHTPRKFESHEWAVTSGTQNQTHTVLEVIRPLTASGHEIQTGDVTVIWSIGEDDDTSQHHAQRGSATVTIIPNQDDNEVDIHGRDADSEITTQNGSKKNKNRENSTRECCWYCDQDEIQEEEKESKWGSGWFRSSSSRSAPVDFGILCPTLVFAMYHLF